jgi:aquaporin related protein
MGLLVTAWVFYRVSGAVFNPAITFALWLIGGLTLFRATLLTIAQILGGIAASALVSGLTPYGGTEMLLITLGGGTNVAQGLFLEVLLPLVISCYSTDRSSSGLPDQHTGLDCTSSGG